MTEKSKSPYQQVVANFPFHDFNQVAKFTGIYESAVTLGDPEKLDKDGKTTSFEANIFIDIETGEALHITNSYSVDKAIKIALKDYEIEMKSGNMVFDIEFLGKTEIKGKPFNQFNIGFCTLQQYESFYASTKVKAK